jgi:Nucleotidyl transferase AbiEii toxin, Type IV TA system
MALFRDHPDFAAGIGIAAQRLGLHPQFVEKDYWVTETLRVLTEEFGGEFTFKGGTSLSKGYGLIQRFSEDVDIIVTRDAGDSIKKREKKLEEMSQRVAEGLGLERKLDDEPGRGKSPNRSDLLLFEPLIPKAIDTGIEESGVLLELGFAGTEVPAEVVEIEAMVTAELGVDPVEFEDARSFRVRALDPARTCLEKICGMHHLATQMLDEPAMEVPRMGRHYWDIDRLLEDPSVRRKLTDRDGFSRLVGDVELVSATHFRGATPRPEGGFAESPAFRPPSEIRGELENLYNAASVLLPTTTTERWPSFGEMLKRIGGHSALL